MNLVGIVRSPEIAELIGVKFTLVRDPGSSPFNTLGI